MLFVACVELAGQGRAGRAVAVRKIPGTGNLQVLVGNGPVQYGAAVNQNKI